MAQKKYDLKLAANSPILEFDEWFAEKKAVVKGNPPRKYKAKTKTLIIEILEKFLSGENLSGYKELIADFNISKDKSDLEILADTAFKNNPEKLKTFKEFAAEIKKKSK